MTKYLLGFLKFLFFKNISILSMITSSSNISIKSRINRFVKVYNSSIGKYSYIGSNSEIINTSIGKFCSIASDCIIGLASHTIEYVSSSPIFTESKNGTGYSWIKKDIISHSKSQVIIGNDVWIGRGVKIMGGISIGDGAVIGAGSIVTKDVPSYAIFAGVPAKIIRFRFSESIITKLNEIKWWDLPDKKIIKNIHLFQQDLIDIQQINQLLTND